MKNSTKMVSTNQRGLSAALIAIFTLLLAMTWSARAQYTLVSGTDFLNVYFADSTGTIFGVNPLGPPTDYLSALTATPVSSAYLTPGSEITSAFFGGGWGALPGPVLSGSYTASYPGSGGASGSVNFVDSPSYATNPVHSVNLGGVGSAINLTYGGTGIAEMRLDWTADYTFSCGPAGAPIAPVIVIGLTGTVHQWVGVAGQISYEDITTPASTSVAPLPIGGDYPSVPYPLTLVTAAPNATFFGFANPPTLNINPFTRDVGIGTSFTAQNNDVIEVVGFLDVLVDPGTVQITIEPAPAPNITSAKPAGSNLVIQATNGVAGVTYVTCRSTSLTAPLSTWLPVSTNIATNNGNFSFIATNSVVPANRSCFYFLQAE